ncbi:TDG/mug DNA glycosylase family protein [Bacillus ectoiniformans]|uniref:G/U mismatch-specific DNA glycosylase n=1 Tax=Bacillus ectoiniformans TaxID=1494429 RepID=UPI00195EE1E2|nr:TDG/mug DNA glycosylase family protein [Bacillus ectoiniformans]
MQPIRDHLQENLDVLFVGFNPSLMSGETGHHFANPTNRFWKILFQAGLTPCQLQPHDDYKLLEYGYGLTNIVERPTKAAQDITMEEYEVGRAELKRKIKHYQPKVVCYVGKGVYQQYSKRKQVAWGVQQEPIIQNIQDFVAPSSSGLVRMPMEEIVKIYSELTNLIKK